MIPSWKKTFLEFLENMCNEQRRKKHGWVGADCRAGKWYTFPHTSPMRLVIKMGGWRALEVFFMCKKSCDVIWYDDSSIDVVCKYILCSCYYTLHSNITALFGNPVEIVRLVVVVSLSGVLLIWLSASEKNWAFIMAEWYVRRKTWKRVGKYEILIRGVPRENKA